QRSVPRQERPAVPRWPPRTRGDARLRTGRAASSWAYASPFISSTEPTASAACTGMKARMNGSAGVPWRRSQRRLQDLSRLISPMSVIVDLHQPGIPAECNHSSFKRFVAAAAYPVLEKKGELLRTYGKAIELTSFGRPLRRP